MAVLEIACQSDIGTHHPVNQDAGGAWVFKRRDGLQAVLLVVADGVSAGEHSEDASRLAVSTLHGRMSPLLEGDASTATCRDALVNAIEEAHRLIARRPHPNISSADATTLVAAVALAGTAFGAWVGDSRVYLVRDRMVRQLTTDHSWAEGVVSRGLMTAEQAAADPRAHVITRWLGPPEDRDVGVETFEARLSDGDVVLCCTDGLYMYFVPPNGSEDEIGVALTNVSSLADGLNNLIETALKRGGYDNITGAALRHSGGSAHRVTEEVPILRPGIR